MSKSNGVSHPTRGKKVTPWTVPSTGVVIQTVPVSFIAISDAMRREPTWAEPEPPLVEVSIAGTQTIERNYADPDFPAVHELWIERFNNEAVYRVMRRLAMVQVLTDEQEEEVAELRLILEGESLHPSDKVVWLLECALGNDMDYRKLLEFVTGQADPREENIEKKAEASV